MNLFLRLTVCVFILLTTHVNVNHATIEGFYFDRIGGDNVALANLMYKETVASSIFRCGQNCMAYKRCLSFNYNTMSSGQGHDCILNIDTVSGSGQLLSTMPGFRHYEARGREAPPVTGVQVKAAGYDAVRAVLYMVYEPWLLLYDDVAGIPGVSPSNFFVIPNVDITGIHVLPGAPADKIYLWIYEENGTVFNVDISLTSKVWSLTDSGNVQNVHGLAAPTHVDDVIEVGGVVYLIEDNTAYQLDGAFQVTSVFDIRDPVTPTPPNPFIHAPMPITAGSQIHNGGLFLLKGVRFYLYSTTNHDVYEGGLIIAE